MQLTAALLVALIGPQLAPETDQATQARGRLDWFGGTYAEAVSEAARRDTLVAVEFWANWCGWCQQHEAQNLVDPGVVASLADFVSFSADCSTDDEGNFVDSAAESLMRRFGVRRFPAIVFVRPGDLPEGLISGYLPAKRLSSEIDRVRRGDQTVSYWEKRIADDPDELENRYQLAIKLDSMGDVAGYQREIETIVRADPAGLSLPSRRMAFGLMREQLWGCMRDPEIAPDPAGLASFLAAETSPELLCNGWLLMGAVETELGQGPGARDAYRKAWKHVPEEEVAGVGNGIAWAFWTQRDELSAAEKRFALDVSRQASDAIQEQSFDPVEHAMYFDTLACCYYMNGKRSKALELMQRCMTLAPDVAEYRDRYELFRSRG